MSPLPARARHSSDVTHVGLDTPGPASAGGRAQRQRLHQLRPPGVGRALDLPKRLSAMLGRPVSYLNDGNAGALWGHWSIFEQPETGDVDLGHHRHGAGRRRDRRAATWSRAAAGSAASRATR